MGASRIPPTAEEEGVMRTAFATAELRPKTRNYVAYAAHLKPSFILARLVVARENLDTRLRLSS